MGIKSVPPIIVTGNVKKRFVECKAAKETQLVFITNMIKNRTKSTDSFKVEMQKELEQLYALNTAINLLENLLTTVS